MKSGLSIVASIVCLFAVIAQAQEPAKNAADAQGQEAPKIKVAVVRIGAILNNGNYYDRVRMMAADKDTLAAIKKVNAEMKDLQKQAIDVDDELKLNDLGRRMQFLNQKLNVLRQHVNSGNPNIDVQAMVRKFVIENYKNKYPIIMQQDSGVPDRLFVWKGGVQTDDITDEVADKFREHLDKIAGE